MAKRLSYQDVYRAATSIMLSLSKSSKTEYREPRFRVSALPFCPILYAGQGPWSSVDYRAGHIFAMGTAIHELIQTFLANGAHSAELYGDWICTGCNTVKRSCVKPKVECKCGVVGAAWKYQELEVVFRNLKGHVDTILQVVKVKGQKPRMIVVDYKTTEFYNGVKNTRKFPVPPNVVQISAYCAILAKVYKLPIDGWALIYTDRTKAVAGANHFHVVAKEWRKKDTNLWVNRLRKFDESYPDAQKAYSIRQKGKTIPRELLTSLVEKRPCKSATDYETIMSPAFYYADGPCPLKESCTRASTVKIVKRVKARLDE
jgi:hypothetical protein